MAEVADRWHRTDRATGARVRTAMASASAGWSAGATKAAISVSGHLTAGLTPSVS